MSAHHFLLAVAPLICVLANPVFASDRTRALGDIQLAGEIIVTPQTANNPSAKAADLVDRARASRKDEAPTNASTIIIVPGNTSQVDRARAYRKDEVPGAPTIIVVPEDEEAGVLTPGRGGAAPSSAGSNRLKARKYQQNGSLSPDSGVLVIEPQSDESTTAARAKDNRARANSYAKGDLQSILTGKVGADGIPLVVCKGVNNQAGRIGDDVESGSVFTIIQNSRPTKVRCQ